jgi:hypothetical protein
VLGHHRRIERVAVASDARGTALLPQIAGRVLHPAGACLRLRQARRRRRLGRRTPRSVTSRVPQVAVHLGGPRRSLFRTRGPDRSREKHCARFSTYRPPAIRVDLKAADPPVQSTESVFEKDRRVCVIHPPCEQLWAGGTTQPVPLGHQRRAVGSDPAAAAGGEDRRPAGEASPPRVGGRDPLCGAHRMRVAATAGRLPLADRVLVVQPLGTVQSHRADPPGGA